MLHVIYLMHGINQLGVSYPIQPFYWHRVLDLLHRSKRKEGRELLICFLLGLHVAGNYVSSISCFTQAAGEAEKQAIQTSYSYMALLIQEPLATPLQGLLDNNYFGSRGANKLLQICSLICRTVPAIATFGKR